MFSIANVLPATFWDDVFPKVLAGVLVFLCTAVPAGALGWWWGWWRGRRAALKEWNEKRFLGRINVSLNSLRDGTLRIRTILERSLEEVFLNPVAVEKVRSAALAVKDDPLLPIDQKDRWFLLNFVLNAVVEHFTLGVIRQDAGQPVQAVRYVLFLTCELEGEDRIRKVRALMVQEEALRDFPYADPASCPNLETSNHNDRVHTLRRAAETYRKEPDLFMRLEVCV